jgi:WD40 repeat protein
MEIQAKHGQQLLFDISDAIKLTLSFAAHPPSKYTPHLYISSLAGSSPRSKLLAHWRSQFHGIPRVHFNQTPEVELMSLEGHTDYVTSVAFSEEGKQGVSGSNDRTVRTWDVQSGRQIQVLEGHTAWVR